jgi:hypothetical protein
MKDPYTLVADLRFMQIWHRDKHGADGACGWTYPRLSEEQRRACKDLGFWEARERHYLRYPFKQYTADLADRVVLYRSLLILVARVIRVNLTVSEAESITAETFSVGGVDGPDRMFCWVPGWHSNNPEDSPDDRARYWSQQVASIARDLLKRKRPWWRHPRWHLWHWRFHVPLLRRWFGWSGIK